MKITLAPTNVIDSIAGSVRARVWEGQTDDGVAVKAWVCFVQPQTHDEKVHARFAAELREVDARRSLMSFDVRLIV